MSKSNSWDPSDYKLEDELKDTINGWTVHADDGYVIKERDGGGGKMFIKDDDDPKGHKHYEKIDGEWVEIH